MFYYLWSNYKIENFKNDYRSSSTSRSFLCFIFLLREVQLFINSDYTILCNIHFSSFFLFSFCICFALCFYFLFTFFCIQYYVLVNLSLYTLMQSYTYYIMQCNSRLCNAICKRFLQLFFPLLHYITFNLIFYYMKIFVDKRNDKNIAKQKLNIHYLIMKEICIFKKSSSYFSSAQS